MIGGRGAHRGAVGRLRETRRPARPIADGARARPRIPFGHDDRRAAVRRGPRGRHRPARRFDRPRAAHHAGGRAPPARLPRLALGGVTLVPLLQRAASISTGRRTTPPTRRRPVAARASRTRGHGRRPRHLHRRAARPGGDRLRRRRRLARPRDRDHPARASRAAPRRPRASRRSRRIVLPSNHRMLQVFHDSGFLVSARRSAAAIEIEFPTSLSREARQRFEERQRVADVAAVAHVLRPASVAVIGASRRDRARSATRSCATCSPEASPGRCTSSTRAAARSPAGRPFARIADVEGDVELAVIAVPAAAVIETARQCAAKGVRALVVLTAGFAEVGPEGRARQDELLAVCRAAGMRMVGPNCLGVANLHHLTAFNATFAPGSADARQRRLRVPERGVRDRGDRRGGGARDRALLVRLDGGQGRPLRQRLPRVLGAGPRHVGAAALSRVVRQPAPVRADRAPDHQATSRSWRSRAAARPPAIAPRPPTPARCSRPPT